MQRSTATVRSQDKSFLNASNLKQLQKQRTATSNRTGGASSSAHTSTGQKPAEKLKPRILDENNQDVTPKPLFEGEPVVKVRHGSALFQSIEGGTSTPTEVMSQGSVLNTNAILTAATSFGAFHESSTHVSSHESNQQQASDSVQETAGDREKEQSALFFTNIEIKPKTDLLYETLHINETPTFILLDIPTTCLSDEDPNAEKVKLRNENYIELCKKKIGNDSFADRGINTFNDLPKIKTTQTERITIVETGVMCTNWDMYDSLQKNEEKTDDKAKIKKSTMKDDKQSDLVTTATKSKSSITTGTIMSETTTITMMAPENISETNDNSKFSKSNYHESEAFRLNAFFMERLLNQNTYQSKQARYRGLKPLVDEHNAAKLAQQYDGLTLEKLWTYGSLLTKDRNVSCIAWNNKNNDILAVGYGRFEYNDDQGGMVCCWCLKNPEFPERYYKTEAGVTSVAFSQKHANILAVGLFNGNIHIFDVRKNDSISLISTSDTDSKHLSPVWNLKWTDKDRASSTGEDDEMEVLMSISSDGRITQWMIRKGFESSDYLKLKRVVSKGGAKKEKSDGLISRHTGGLCFDIFDDDKSIYLCGTEEGYIHRCSTSYNEQYLDSYQGHNGPVYKLAWSPFLKNCFISASSDWTIKLWKSNRFTPCLTFNSATKAVYDICWSNHSATIFCCVNENAVELWDLSKSILDPIYVTSPLASTKFTTISYSPNSDSLIVGTSDGSLIVYAIKNIPVATIGSDLDEIIKQSLISQLENVKIDEDEAFEIIEKHQMDSLNVSRQKTQEEGTEEPNSTVDQLAKLDAFNANLEKIKNQNKSLLEGKKTMNLQPNQSKKQSDSSDSDD